MSDATLGYEGISISRTSARHAAGCVLSDCHESLIWPLKIACVACAKAATNGRGEMSRYRSGTT